MVNKLTKKVLFVLSVCLILPIVSGYMIYCDYSQLTKEISKSIILDIPGCSKQTNILWKLQNNLSLINGIDYSYECDTNNSSENEDSLEVSRSNNFMSYGINKFSQASIKHREDRSYEMFNIPIQLDITVYSVGSSESNLYYVSYKNEFKIGELYYSLYSSYPYDRELLGNDFKNEILKILESSKSRISYLLKGDYFIVSSDCRQTEGNSKNVIGNDLCFSYGLKKSQG